MIELDKLKSMVNKIAEAIGDAKPRRDGKSVSSEGMTIESFPDTPEMVACSKCFKNEGLRLMATEIGTRNNSETSCPICNSTGGVKFNRRLLAKLAKEFFEMGTYNRTGFGGASLVKFNDTRFTEEGTIGCWTSSDAKLIENILHIGFFWYGPHTWKVGINDRLEELSQEGSHEQVIDQIIDQAPVKSINEEFHFYRIRSHGFGKSEFDHSSPVEFDCPRNKTENFDRFDSPNFSVLYGSPDLQTCLHECRVTLEDIVFVAKLSPRRELKLLNLIDFPCQSGLTPHESLKAAVDMLFYAGECSYEITREIAIKARNSGFDGILYPSFIQNLQNKEYNITTLGIPSHDPVEYGEKIQNIAIFGRPIKEGILQVSCINRVILQQSSYVIKMGPVGLNSRSDELFKLLYEILPKSNIFMARNGNIHE